MAASGDSYGPAEKNMDQMKKKIDGSLDPNEQPAEKPATKEVDTQNQAESCKEEDTNNEKSQGEKKQPQEQAERKPEPIATPVIHQMPKKKEVNNEITYQNMLSSVESKKAKPQETGNGSTAKTSEETPSQEKPKEAVANVNVDDKPDREKQPEAAKGNSTLESKLGEVKGKSSDANQSLSEKKTEEDKKKVSTEKVVLPENKASKISQNKIQKKPTPQKIKPQDDEAEVAETLSAMKSKGSRTQGEPEFPPKQSKPLGSDDSMLNKVPASVRNRSKPIKGAQDTLGGKLTHQINPPANLAPTPKSTILPSSSIKHKNPINSKRMRPVKGKEADDVSNSSKQMGAEFTKSSTANSVVSKVSKPGGQSIFSKQTGQSHANGKHERDLSGSEKPPAKLIKTEDDEKLKDANNGGAGAALPAKAEPRSAKLESDGHGTGHLSQHSGMLSAPSIVLPGLNANAFNPSSTILMSNNQSGHVQESKSFSGVDKGKLLHKAGESSSFGVKREKGSRADKGVQDGGAVKTEKAKEGMLQTLPYRISAPGGSSAFKRDQTTGAPTGKPKNCATHVYIAHMIEKEQQSFRQKAIDTQHGSHEHRGSFPNAVQPGVQNIGMQGVNVSSANRGTASQSSISSMRNEKNLPNQLAISAMMDSMSSSPVALAAVPQSVQQQQQQQQQQGQTMNAPNAEFMKQLGMQGLDQTVAMQFQNGMMGNPLQSIAAAGGNSDSRKVNNTSRQVSNGQQSEQMSPMQQNLNTFNMLHMGLANGNISSSAPSSQGFNINNMILPASSPFGAMNLASGSMGGSPHYELLLQAQNAQQSRNHHGSLAENTNSASPSPPVGQSNIPFNSTLAAAQQAQQASGNTQHFPNMSGIGQASTGTSVSQPQMTDSMQMQAQQQAVLMSLLAYSNPSTAQAFLGLLNQSQSTDPGSMQPAKNNMAAESTNESNQMNANQQQHAAISSLSRQSSGGSAVPSSNLADLQKMFFQFGQNPSLSQHAFLAAQQQQSQMGNLPQNHMGQGQGQGQGNMVFPSLPMNTIPGMPLSMAPFQFFGGPVGMQLPSSNQQQQPR